MFLREVPKSLQACPNRSSSGVPRMQLNSLSKSLKFQSQKAGRYSCVCSLSRSADAHAKTAGLRLDRCNVLPHLIASRTTLPLHTRITNASRRAQSPSWKTVCVHGSSLGSLRPERRLPAPSQGSSLLGSAPTDPRSDHAPLGPGRLVIVAGWTCGVGGHRK